MYQSRSITSSQASNAQSQQYSMSQSQTVRKQQLSQLQSPSVLNQFDLTPIREIDPILSNGYIEHYAVRLPFLLRFLDSSDDPEHHTSAAIEYVNVRLLTKHATQKNSQQAHLAKFTIEVSCENDLFFYYFHNIDAESFEQLREQQRLDGDFIQYFQSTHEFLERCSFEPQKFACVFNIRSDSSAYLQIIQTLNYKDVEVLRYEMVVGDADIIRQHVSYKYAAKRSWLNMVDGRIKDVNEIVKLKNPQLLLHISKILSNSSNSSNTTGSVPLTASSITHSSNKQLPSHQQQQQQQYVTSVYASRVIEGNR